MRRVPFGCCYLPSRWLSHGHELLGCPWLLVYLFHVLFPATDAAVFKRRVWRGLLVARIYFYAATVSGDFSDHRLLGDESDFGRVRLVLGLGSRVRREANAVRFGPSRLIDWREQQFAGGHCPRCGRTDPLYGGSFESEKLRKNHSSLFSEA